MRKWHRRCHLPLQWHETQQGRPSHQAYIVAKQLATHGLRKGVRDLPTYGPLDVESRAVGVRDVARSTPILQLGMQSSSGKRGMKRNCRRLNAKSPTSASGPCP